jgi:hypothetical protein
MLGLMAGSQSTGGRSKNTLRVLAVERYLPAQSILSLSTLAKVNHSSTPFVHYLQENLS